ELADVLETIRGTRPTMFPGVPTMYVAVNSFPHAEEFGLDSIKYYNSGAAPMPTEVMHAFESRFGGEILEGYGLSEASPFTHGHPAGRERWVADVPDDYRGETVKAFVVVRPGASLVSEDLTHFCRERLAAYKVPKVVEFRTSLPKSTVGKILRRQLVDPGTREEVSP